MDFSFIEDPELRAKAEADYAESLKTAIDTEVMGLKTKNEQLILEKKTASDSLAEQMALADGIDLEAARDAMNLLEKTKRKDLLQDGKLDEYIMAEVQTKEREIQNKYQSQLEIATQERDAIAQSADKYSALYRNKIIEDSLRGVAMKSGCTPDAEIINDIISRGRGVFALDGSETNIEAKNSDGTYKKTADGDKILTPEAWMEDLKKQCPYYFPASLGTGANGGGNNSNNNNDNGEDLIQKKIAQALDAGDMKLYRALRKEQGAGFR